MTDMSLPKSPNELLTPCQQLGAIIADSRKKACLSVRELSKLSGVPYPNISNFELGKYNASIDVVSKILAPLGKKLCIVDAFVK